MLGSIIGSVIGAGSSLFGASKDRAFQAAQAKKSVQWRAEDAKKAGLHPLATMGYGGTGYSPVGDGGAGAVISQAGQQIDQHMNAAPKNKLATQLAQSSMSVDQANVQLLQAQKLQILDNIRKGSVGLKGGTTPLPVPGSAKGTPIYVGGKKLPQDPNTSDAEAWEQRYGDIAQEIGGAVNVYQDFAKPHMRAKVNRMSKADRENLSWLNWLIPQISYHPKGK